MMSQYPDCLIYTHKRTHTHARLQRHAYCVVRILISMCIEKAKQPTESHVVVYEIGDGRYDNVHRKVDEIPTTMPSHFILITQYFFIKGYVLPYCKLHYCFFIPFANCILIWFDSLTAFWVNRIHHLGKGLFTSSIETMATQIINISKYITISKKNAPVNESFKLKVLTLNSS